MQNRRSWEGGSPSELDDVCRRKLAIRSFIEAGWSTYAEQIILPSNQAASAASPLQTVYDLAAKRRVGLRFNCKNLTSKCASLRFTCNRQLPPNYVQGLLMPGQRKSIEPMAARLGIEPQRLQQFMADSPWDETELWRVIRREVVPHFEPIEAWIVDETGWLKQGKNSVGVAHQYCGAVGKQANCQVSVELVVSDGFVAAPVGGRLYLPQSWIDDPQRCAKAGVPPDVGFATKNEIALTLIEQALADQVVPAPVLGDAAYGNSFAFRTHLRELNLEFFLQVTPE